MDLRGLTRLCYNTAMTTLLTVDDTTFRRNVLRAELPVLVCFSAPDCAASAGLRPALQALATAYGGRLRIAETSCDATIAEQYGIAASPTLLVFRYGDELLRSVGFLPPSLLALLAEDALSADHSAARMWAPLEEQFEDAELLPLIEALGWQVQRQQRIINWPGSKRSGRIDLLVYDDIGPITLIESKRALASSADLRQATKQAHSYAQAMRVPSFVVAAPAGLWVYALHGQQAIAEQAFSWLELQDGLAPLRAVLMKLRESGRWRVGGGR